VFSMKCYSFRRGRYVRGFISSVVCIWFTPSPVIEFPCSSSTSVPCVMDILPPVSKSYGLQETTQPLRRSAD